MRENLIKASFRGCDPGPSPSSRYDIACRCPEDLRNGTLLPHSTPPFLSLLVFNAGQQASARRTRITLESEMAANAAAAVPAPSISTLPEVCSRRISSYLKVQDNNAMASTAEWALNLYLQYQEKFSIGRGPSEDDEMGQQGQAMVEMGEGNEESLRTRWRRD